MLEKHADFLVTSAETPCTPAPWPCSTSSDLGGRLRRAAQEHRRTRRAPRARRRRGTRRRSSTFSRLRHPHPYVAMVPQWHLLNLLAQAAGRETTFTLRMESDATGVIHEGGESGGQIPGPTERVPAGRLTVACDGRTSTLRREPGPDLGRIPGAVRPVVVPAAPTAGAVYSMIPHTRPGRALIIIPRDGYYQIAYLIPKGGDARLRERGLDALKPELDRMIPEVPTDASTHERGTT